MRPEVVTTKEAAEILDLSVTSVQRLADKDTFVSWKTSGGHRRYDKNSLLIYKKRLQNSGLDNSIKNGKKFFIKIISNEYLDINGFLSKNKDALCNFDISLWPTLPEAYLSFSEQRPDIIIFSMNIPLRQQIENLLALDEFINSSFKKILAICLTKSRNLEFSVRHDISGSVKIVDGAITDQWLDTFLLGLLASLPISEGEST